MQAIKRQTMKETGYTRVDNKIFDAQPFLSPIAFSVLMRMVRMIDGYGNDDKGLSNTFLQSNCNMSKNTVSKAVGELVEFGFLDQKRQQRKTTIYSLNYENIADFNGKNYGQKLASQNLASQDMTIRFPKSDHQLGQNMGGNKEKKEKPLKKNSIDDSAKTLPAKKPKELNISFDTFWDLYDHKSTNKKTAQTKWKNLTNQQRQAVIDHLPAYIQSTPDKTYRKHPSSYLTQEHWNTPIEKTTANKIDRTTDKLAVNQNWAGANKSNIVESNITLEEMMGSW